LRSRSAEEIRAYFGSRYHIVAVKLFREVPGGYPVPEKKGKFCEFVMRAARGETLLMRAEDEECHLSLIALGFQEPRYLDLQPRIQPAETRAVLIAPAEKMEDADVLMMIATPRQVMEISAMLGGIKAEFAGEIAVCGEAVAKPIKTGRANVSFLCGGARMLGGYRDSEVIIAAPPEVFAEIAEKVRALQKTCGALCGCRTSELPEQVVMAMSEAGFEKGIDYFFGRVNSRNVRLYLNKDTSGRIEHLTVHFPVRGEVEVEEPLRVQKRGAWSDVYAILRNGEGFDIYTGEGVKELVEKLSRKIKTKS